MSNLKVHITLSTEAGQILFDEGVYLAKIFLVRFFID